AARLGQGEREIALARRRRAHDDGDLGIAEIDFTGGRLCVPAHPSRFASRWAGHAGSDPKNRLGRARRAAPPLLRPTADRPLAPSRGTPWWQARDRPRWRTLDHP